MISDGFSLEGRVGEGDLGQDYSTQLRLENISAAQGEDKRCSYHWQQVNQLLPAK